MNGQNHNSPLEQNADPDSALAAYLGALEYGSPAWQATYDTARDYQLEGSLVGGLEKVMPERVMELTVLRQAVRDRENGPDGLAYLASAANFEQTFGFRSTLGRVVIAQNVAPGYRLDGKPMREAVGTWVLNAIRQEQRRRLDSLADDEIS